MEIIKHDLLKVAKYEQEDQYDPRVGNNPRLGNETLDNNKLKKYLKINGPPSKDISVGNKKPWDNWTPDWPDEDAMGSYLGIQNIILNTERLPISGLQETVCLTSNRGTNDYRI